MSISKMFCALAILLCSLGMRAQELRSTTPTRGEISAVSYASIQQALEHNPGRMVYLPAGDYRVTDTIRILRPGSGLFGPGRIIQTNPKTVAILIDQTTGVQVRDITVMRQPNETASPDSPILIINSADVILDNVRVIDSGSEGEGGAIGLRSSTNCEVRDCLVRNYRSIGVEDRSQGNDWGYAFRSLIGTGISVGACRGTILRGNRVEEQRLQATPRIQKQYKLGEFTKRNPTKGLLTPQVVWDAGHTDGWTQGSGIVVGGQSDRTQIIGNSIEHAFQGMDLHSDHAVVSGNMVHDAAVGIKAMHGARNVQITGNQFVGIDLYGIYLLSGAGSHPAGYREGSGAPMEANVDGGHLVANNIISDFGTGSTGWLLPKGALKAALRFDNGQKPMNPPVREVIVTGNMVYDTNRDGVLENGTAKVPPPPYHYAVHISGGSDGGLGHIAGPEGLHFSNNLFHPGTQGVSNVELKL